MCFSAEVSIGMGTLLTGIGSWTAFRARGTPRFPLALMPIGFGIQQFSEGGVWQGISTKQSIIVEIAATLYLAIAYGVWPAWVPVITRSAETVRPRLHSAFRWVGGVYGLISCIWLGSTWSAVMPRIQGHSICYRQTPVFQPMVFEYLYPIIVVGPWLLSSDRALRRFGALGAASAVIAFTVQSLAFASVWCFFAAALSALVVVTINRDGSAEEKI